MAKPITIPFTFQTQAGPIPLSELDTDFSTGANAINDFATYSNFLSDTSGAANQITVTIPVGTTFSYSLGVKLEVLLANTNTSTAVQINVSGLGNKAVQNIDGTVPAIGQLVAGMILTLQYNGTVFLITGAASKPGSIAPFTSNAAGDVTLPAPSSGIAMTLTGLTGQPGLQVQVPVTAVNGAIQIYDSTNTTIRGYIGGGATVTGQGVGDFILAPTGSGNLIVGRANGAAIGTTFGANGNVTVLAPSSGIALNVVGAAISGQPALTVSGANFAGARGLTVQGGTASSDFALIVQNATGVTNLLLINGDGSVQVGAPTGGAQGVGTINATGLFVNGKNLSGAGTFTGTLTGCTTSPTATFNYVVSGNIAIIYLISVTLTATSNSTSCSINGLPAALTPTNAVAGLATTTDNGTTSATGLFQVSGTTMTLGKAFTSGVGGFTAAGTKGLGQTGVMFVYPLA